MIQMNPKLEKYLFEKKEERQKLINQKKNELLMREGLYDEVLIGRGKTESYEENVESKWNFSTEEFEHYKQVPIKISNEEYEALKQVCAPLEEEISDNTGNKIAIALTIIAYVVYLCGFILGIVMGNVEVEGGYLYTYSYTEFSFAIALTYWAVSLISGTLFLGFAEIIKLLDDIKRK